jgi:hypothetical protein
VREVDLLDAAIAAVRAEGERVDAAAFSARWRSSAPRRPRAARPDRSALELAVTGDRREIAQALLDGRAAGRDEVVVRLDDLRAAPSALWTAAAAAKAGFRTIALLVDPALLDAGRLDALARAGVTRVLPWVAPGVLEDADRAGSAALDGTSLEVLPVLPVDADTLAELPALGERAASLHPRAGALGLWFRPGALAHHAGGPGELPLLRLQETAHALGLPLRSIGPAPPPCAFEGVRALRDLFLFDSPETFPRIGACADCALRSRCPGVDPRFTRAFEDAELHAVRDDLEMRPG